MNEADLLKLINEQPFGIAEFTAKSGHYLFFNEKERLLRCLSRHQLQAVCVFDLFDEDERDTLKKLFAQCLKSSAKQAHFFDYKKGNRYFQMRLSPAIVPFLFLVVE